MDEGDKSIDVGEETSTRVSDGSQSWLFAKRQRFTIELRPGETTIVSWKRLVKDAQNTSPPLTALNTEDSLDEGFQDDKSTSKQNGLSINSDKLELTNGTVLSVAQPSRKRRKYMAEARVEKVDDLVPSKHAKVEQGRLNFAATNAVLEEQSPALLQNSAIAGEPDRRFHDLFYSVRSTSKLANTATKSELSSYTEVSNKDVSISPSISKDVDKCKSVTFHSSDLGHDTNSLATHQKYLEKRSCKKYKSPIRKLMTENDKEGISIEVEKRKKRATCGELPDLNLPAYPVQSELAKLWPNGIMDKHEIKSAICRAKERKRKSCEIDKVREVRRKKSAQKMEVSVQGEASSVSQLQAVQENQEPASSSHILILPYMPTSCKETLHQHLAAPLEITSVLPISGLDIFEEKKIEKMKQKGKSKNRVKKLSMELGKESRKSHKKAIGHPDAAS